jgi:NAD+ kinase
MTVFTRIGIFSKPNLNAIGTTLQQLINFLQQRKHSVIIEDHCQDKIMNSGIKFLPSDQIGKNCDLVIVVGGDGSMLKAARAIVDDMIPVIGINRGNLGFLADVDPSNLETTLTEILDGAYISEHRTVLNAKILKNKQVVSEHLALNDVVLHHGDIARLIEFEVYIDDQFVLDQRSDGIITCTPTGSTAYALSGGGPIVYPTLDVLCIVPMFPHTLSARPVVIDKDSKIRLVVADQNKVDAKISCDGQTHMSLTSGDELHIQAHHHTLHLLHPKDYNYYNVLREKLGWNLKFNK